MQVKKNFDNIFTPNVIVKKKNLFTRKKWRKFLEQTDLTELRWPRSSEGSLESLTASITTERRSTSFLSSFCGLWGDEGDEAHLNPDLTPWLAVTCDDDELFAVDILLSRDDVIVLWRRVPMASLDQVKLRFCRWYSPEFTITSMSRGFS